MSNKKEIQAESNFRSDSETLAAQKIVETFENSKDSTADKLKTFPRYIRRQDATRFLACYEIFKRILNIKGSIIDCGVFRGFTFSSWAHFSTIMEPANLTRRIYGFDSFSGFPSTHEKDQNKYRDPNLGDLNSGALEELTELMKASDMNRYLGHVNKFQLIDGPAEDTIPKFVEENKHLVVSLLFLDFDLYEPTRVAIKHLFDRIPKGGIIAFDELDNPIWPGETMALLEELGIGSLKFERVPFDPYIGYAIKE